MSDIANVPGIFAILEYQEEGELINLIYLSIDDLIQYRSDNIVYTLFCEG